MPTYLQAQDRQNSPTTAPYRVSEWRIPDRTWYRRWPIDVKFGEIVRRMTAFISLLNEQLVIPTRGTWELHRYMPFGTEVVKRATNLAIVHRRLWAARSAMHLSLKLGISNEWSKATRGQSTRKSRGREMLLTR